MEWAHTAQVFNSTLESLRQSHALASEESTANLDKEAATAFLTSFYDRRQEFLPSHDEAPAEGWSMAELLQRRQSSRADAHHHHIDLTKKAGWRHRFVHWFTESHSVDKESETSYYELLHLPGPPNVIYDPLALDYSGLYWALSEAQREALSLHGLGMPSSPRPSFTNPAADLLRLPPLGANVSKEQLNLQFMMEHPLIDRSFTGSKLRSLRALLVGLSSEIQVVTCAAAWVYFEKLVSVNKVNKENRRLVFGACVSLSSKFHEDKRAAIEVLSAVAAAFSSDVAPRDIALKEFHVFAALSFDLRVSELELLPHLRWLQNATALASHVAIDVCAQEPK